MNKTMRLLAALTILIVGAGALASCEDTQSEAAVADTKTADQMLADFQKSQPIPRTRYSQQRQNLIEVTQAQQAGAATTTFFMLEGVDRPIAQCPSVGYPIATTAQLTSPDQVFGSDVNREGGRVVIAQMEPTGIYTGESSGTYVICVNGNGDAYAQYWEGYTMTVTGQAAINEQGEIELVGEPSAEFSTGKN